MRSNIHTHSTFCDGHNPPEEMIQKALSEHFECLGFSGHSFAPFDLSCGMNPEETLAYRNCILELKKTYEDRICILLGLEQDMDSPTDDYSWDYRIGSIHYMEKDGIYLALDNTPAIFTECLNTFYEGNMMKLVASYLEKEVRMFETRRPDVIGHFDLYRKYNNTLHCLDETLPEYQQMVYETLKELTSKGAVFEVNTGAISRGYLSDPYPSAVLLPMLKELHAPVIITTDCHKKELLTANFEDAKELLKAIGFKSMLEMTGHGFEETALS